MEYSVHELLSRLCGAVGTSGWEEPAADTLCTLLQEIAPEAAVHRDAMGSVTAFLGNPQAERQVLVDAHLDQIGMVVTHITEQGFLRIANVGGMDRRILPTSAVTVCGKEALQGVVAFLPPHLTGKDDTGYPEFSELAIDLGREKAEVERLVSLGDRVVVQGPFRRLLGTRVTGAALDDRAGCAALLLCMQELQQKSYDCGVTFSFTSREETGCEGAKTTAYRIQPTEALVVDVTFGDQPGVTAEQSGKLGGGPMIGVAASLSRSMKDKLVSLCQQQGIPYALEVMGGRTGTNADTIGVTGGGIPAVTISIPLRYMHTPAEVIDTADVVQTAALLTAYLTGGDC